VISLQRSARGQLVFHFDNEMLVTPHLFTTPGSAAPLLHLRRNADDGMFSRFADHFVNVWTTTKAIEQADQQGKPPMARKDYYDDPDAPAPNSIVAAASAIVTNDEGEILVHRRTDNDLWALPGGGMEFGESISDTVVREVQEETGLRVSAMYVVAVYFDPKHVFAYTDGEVRQEFSVCVAYETIDGELKISDESKELKFVHPLDIDQLTMHPRIRARVTDYLDGSRGGLNPG